MPEKTLLEELGLPAADEALIPLANNISEASLLKQKIVQTEFQRNEVMSEQIIGISIYLTIILILCFIWKKFKNFSNIKKSIINNLVNYGFNRELAIEIYDNNYDEMHKMHKVNHSAGMIAHHYSDKYYKLNDSQPLQIEAIENKLTSDIKLSTKLKEQNKKLNTREIEIWGDKIFDSIVKQLFNNEISKNEIPLEIEFGYILGYVDGYLQCKNELDDAKHLGLATYVLMRCFNLKIASSLIEQFMKMDKIITLEIQEGLNLGMRDAKIVFENKDAQINGLTVALNK